MAGYAYGFDDGGAIPDDQGESYTPPPQDQQTPPAVPNDQSAAPVLADVGEPGSDQLLPRFKQEMGQEVSNVEQNPVVQFTKRAIDVNGAPHGAPYGGYGKRIIQYLMGGDAADPATAQKFVQGAKLEHPELDDSDANLVAVHKATEQGGQSAGWAMLQYNRMAYNAKQAFAAAAVNGTDGKPADLQAAAQAATQASQHMLDGSSATFTSTGSGVTATVKMPGTNKTTSYNLTPEQFAGYVNVGGEGQWDKVMGNGGIAATLQKLTASQATPTNTPQGASQAQADQDKGTQAPDGGYAGQATGEGAPTQFLSRGGKAIPGENDQAGDVVGSNEKQQQNPYDNDLQQMAHDKFPWISQARQKADWLSAMQEQRNTAEAEQQNKVAVAKEQGTFRFQAEKARGSDAAANRNQGNVAVANIKAKSAENVANTRAQSYALAQQNKAQLALANLSARTRDADMRNRINLATRLINNPNWATQDAGERNAIIKQYGLDKMGVPLDQQGASTPPAGVGPLPGQDQNGRPQTQVTTSPARKLGSDGRWYVRGPDGKAQLDPRQSP